MTIQIVPLYRNAHNHAGQVFGRAIAIAPVRLDNGGLGWLCACQCGRVFARLAGDLKPSKKLSCGCLNSHLRHGMANTSEYQTWDAMVQRCTNPKNPFFHHYGGRGITVCAAWKESFSAFYADMGDRPDNRTLDRINNNGPYSPENCRWATRSEQQSNRRPAGVRKMTRRIEHNGLALTRGQWAKRLGISKSGLQHRLKAGWSLDRVLSEVKGRWH